MKRKKKSSNVRSKRMLKNQKVYLTSSSILLKLAVLSNTKRMKIKIESGLILLSLKLAFAISF